MKNPTPATPKIRRQSAPPLMRAAALLVCLVMPSLVQAGILSKTNNTANLNTAGAWVNNAVPGVLDIAQWDSAAAGITTNALGATMGWSGIRVLNPGAPVLINAGNTLTNGAAGIDMSAATVNLAMSNGVAIGGLAHQTWTVAPGLTLSTLAIPNRAGTIGAPGNTGIVTFGTTGDIQLGAVASALLTDNQANPWATYGSSDWAALDASGNVIAATYSEASGGITAGNNVDVDVNASVGTVSVNSVRFNSATPTTLSINSGATFTARGILVTPNCGGALITNAAASGFMRVNRSSVVATPFTIIQNSPNDLTIATTISTISSGTATAGILVVKYGPGNVNLTGQNSYVNGTYVVEGRLTVGAGAGLGSGGVTVTNSQVIINATNTTGVPGLVINNGGTNTINVNYLNGQLTCLPVSFGAGTERLQFNYKGGVGMSTITPPLLVSNLTANGAITVDILSGNPSVGVFPLVKYTNSFSGLGFPAFTLGVLPLRTAGYLSNDTANTSIDLVVTNVAEPLKWATGSGIWDIATTANWVDATGASTTYQQTNGFGDSVLFEDTASGPSPITVTLNVNPTPGAVTVNSTKNYSIVGSGSISGGTSLTKAGSGTLVVGTINTFNGGVNLNGGILNFSTITNLGVGSITFNGGTLQYNGNTDDLSTRTVTFAAGGGTIDTAGQTVNYAGPVGNGGPGGLTKAGSGTLTLNETNTYHGNTVVSAGTLQVGANNTFFPNTPDFSINSGAVLDVSLPGTLTLSGQMLSGSGSVNGSVTEMNNSSISPGTNGIFGTLTIGGNLLLTGGALQGGTIYMDVSTTNSDLLAVTGTLQLLNANAGTVQINNINTLTNGVYKLFTVGGVAGAIGNLTVSSSQLNKAEALVLNGNEIDLVVSTAGNSTNVWAGDGGANAWDIDGSPNWITNGVLGAYFDDGDAVIFDDTSVNTTVYMEGTMAPKSMVLNVTNNNYVFQDGTGNGSGKIGGATTAVTINGVSTNTTTFNTDNNYGGPTTLNNGAILVVGSGNGGDIGAGAITNNGQLIFNQGDGNTHNVAGPVSGTGSLLHEGSVTLVLEANNTYAGSTTISNSDTVLQVGNGGAAGTLGAGPVVDNGLLVLDRTGSYTLSNAISGSGVFAMAGSGTVTLSGANTYLNNTYITNGTVKLGASEAIPDANSAPGSTGWLILDGGTTAGIFDLNGFNETINSLSGVAGTVNGIITDSGTSTSTTNVLTILENAGTTYNGVINENPSGSKVQVVLLGNTELRFNGNSTYSGGTLVGGGATIGFGPGAALGTSSVTLSNGATLNIHANGGTGAFVNNNIIIPDNSVGQIASSSLGNGFGGSVFGGVTATNLISTNGGAGISFSAVGVMQHSNFMGTVVVQSGAELRFSSTSTLTEGGSNTTFDVEGTLHVRDTGTVTIGALEGGGVINTPTVSGTGTWIVGSKNLSPTYSGQITGTNNLAKTGTGSLTLNGVITATNTDGSTFTNNVYTQAISFFGTATINSGTLTVIAPNNLTNCSSITLGSSNAVLNAVNMGYVSNYTDMNGNAAAVIITNGVFEISAGPQPLSGLPETLNGIGTIQGNMVVDNTAGISPGLPTGTLTVNGSSEIAGVVTMSLNRTNAATSSELAASTITIDPTATLVVTNVGPGLVNGTTFTLFSKPVSGFASIVLPLTDPTGTTNYTWTTDLSSSGSITLTSGGVSPIATNPTNIVASVSSGNLVLTWPADHVGWYLQVQTNSLNSGLGNNWVDVPGSSTVNTETIQIVPGNPTVFYRMSLNP